MKVMKNLGGIKKYPVRLHKNQKGSITYELLQCKFTQIYNWRRLLSGNSGEGPVSWKDSSCHRRKDGNVKSKREAFGGGEGF